MTATDGQSPISDMKLRYFVVGHLYELGSDLNTSQQVIKTWDGKQEQSSIILENLFDYKTEACCGPSRKLVNIQLILPEVKTLKNPYLQLIIIK